MANLEEIRENRVKKLKRISSRGFNPYPQTTKRTHQISEVLKNFSKLRTQKKEVGLAGRITSLRLHGGAAFSDLRDGTGKIQTLFRKDKLGEKGFKFFQEFFDIGDFIELKGILIKTKTGEKTLEVSDFKILAKSLRPLPEKWHGLKDIEERFRKRYLDLIFNQKVKEKFELRSKIIKLLREFLEKEKFLEVETPILQPIYGGATASPFKTHLNSLKMDVYLRISNELYLKRLIIGGFEKVYEFAKDFRNEDIDRTHNPEFTQVEVYQAFGDFTDMQELVMDLFINAAKALHGSTEFGYQGKKVDVKKPWQKFTMLEAIKKFGELDVKDLSEADLIKLCREKKIELNNNPTKGEMIEALFEELVEDKLIQPTFITDYPVESTPLCKICRDDPDNCFIERFEVFIAGMELGNAYSELNDPVIQRKLLEDQAKKLRSGAEEAHPMDEDFIQAVEYGMPPTGGVGIGIDRMTMLLTNQKSIRDVIFFPFMKK